MTRTRVRSLVAVIVAAASTLGGVGAVAAHASTGATPRTHLGLPDPPPANGAHRYRFEFGPVDITPGQNLIQYSRGQVPKPPMDGWITRIAPNIRLANGTVPRVDVIHLHHGVWLNASRQDVSLPRLPERFFAAGEEKTIMELPTGFGYRYSASDSWIINYMIHDLTPKPFKVWITYDIDLIPATTPTASSVRDARPVWMDVQNGSVYPVFDALKGSGAGGQFTYPDQAAADPYAGQAKNVWTATQDGVLLSTGGHFHPGGLFDDLSMQRNGQSAHLFRSHAHYFEPAGAVSWDVAAEVTNPTWRVAIHPGDQLRVSTTYDTRNASWYESMGIMVVWMASGTDGADPFTAKVDGPGHLTHGHLPENSNHGGSGAPVYQTVAARKGAPAGASSTVNIGGFTYSAGDLSQKSAVPTVQAGQTITFVNRDAPRRGIGIWHSVTACKAPCDQATGIAYPLANASVQFDSGQLGVDGPPTVGTLSWTLPASLAPGTYTYFCRIHPFMRGAFRVVTAG